ncbi:MAG TPA: adenylate/guanylate cyclase domain-containing protein [Candidatus Limnocylindrales bacterium]|nr:adenylate/guanylate cyclase domain-containing protein [Candidatus Limnocylindrales bacterium]
MTDVAAPTSSPPDPLAAGLAALDRHHWQEAFELLSQADRERPLTGRDLEALSVAAFFAARAEAVEEIKERAFRVHLEAGDRVRAAYLAFDLADAYGMRGKTSIAAAWVRRGERLLEGEPESYAHGYLELRRSDLARARGALDEAITHAEAAAAIARRTGDRDLDGWALTKLGQLRVTAGAAADGLALLEEASIAAVNGDLSPFAAGVICCTMISVCRDLTDYQRASEWIEATDRYCRRQSLSGFPGVCRIHRAEVEAIAGAWDRAEQELRQATTELERYEATPPMADGYYALGEIRRLRGDYPAAEEALRLAHQLGRSPQPALALIRLAQGRLKPAAAAIASALEDEPWDRWAKARLLPAQVEIAIASGDRERARAAVDELESIVGLFRSPTLQATLHSTKGRLLLAEREPTRAVAELREAVRAWRSAVNPYEVARARALLARALRALDDDEGADLELRAAHEEFRRLGAMPDAEATGRELQAAAARASAPVKVRKTLMFTDIVGSTRFAEILGDEAWERLLEWHDRTIRRLVEAGGGAVVNSTGDGFFAVFDGARAGVEAAIAIQRALDEHRRSTGFAPAVRIGLHTAEASRRGDDYSGIAVNVAARVAGLAEAGEIVATGATLDEAGETQTADPREVSLKGISAPMPVATVRWA